MSIFTRNRPATEDTVFDAATTAVDDISGDYTLDTSHTRLGFSARHAMVTTVRGSFPSFEGTAKIDTANPAASSVSLAIDVAGIETGNADRDGHLRSGDFFDAEQFPTITFTSTEVVREDENTWQITGDLTIKGVTKPVTIEFESTGSARDPFGNLRVGFEGATSINRKDWGLTWNAALETGGVLVSEKIKLEFDVSAIQNA
ncbi:polyisoprenoid-binding protein [Nocardioides guangzhouensis]|uniref:Polyisoprenoid-binding protein n=1 Tax=Nocardioides guangzhouensis TaxID=2497878 RepID=A0A4Q4Z9L8_9ACTN|nr:YceI family protein [Nocardioides guangzhouensis]RYP83901.1 polyisoprenoid-binding protein [Nocardioides guangzhouensis]